MPAPQAFPAPRLAHQAWRKRTAKDSALFLPLRADAECAHFIGIFVTSRARRAHAPRELSRPGMQSRRAAWRASARVWTKQNFFHGPVCGMPSATAFEHALARFAPRVIRRAHPSPPPRAPFGDPKRNDPASRRRLARGGVGAPPRLRARAWRGAARSPSAGWLCRRKPSSPDRRTIPRASDWTSPARPCRRWRR